MIAAITTPIPTMPPVATTRMSGASSGSRLRPLGIITPGRSAGASRRSLRAARRASRSASGFPSPLPGAVADTKPEYPAGAELWGVRAATADLAACLRAGVPIVVPTCAIRNPGPATPRLRGVAHQWAFVASIFTGVALVLSVPSARARLAAAIYAVSVAAPFASSALYHRVRWRSPAARPWMRRLDHSMIFVVIAGTTRRLR